jgi:peptide/nickel transport system permease protein
MTKTEDRKTLEMPTFPRSQRGKSLIRFFGYILRRALLIFATILAGVYITVLIANKGGQIDQRVADGVDRVIFAWQVAGWLEDVPEDERPARIEEQRTQLKMAQGFYLPKALRNLVWTWKALRFDWGVSLLTGKGLVQRAAQERVDIREILSKHLPNTLLLVGTAYLLIFLLGIPLALYIASRKHDHWLNRLFTTLSPLSSVPSWIYGILLVAIFAAGFQILPFGGKYDILPPETTWERITVVTRHMILPVTAILLGIIFQLVYVWRTYFTIYSEEDYVELAVAKGLQPSTVERRYVLRPTMPYVLTSFALTLVGFWQVTTALEYFFNWPGIGQLYVEALPNYLGERFYPGDMSVVISIVVLFAFLLGMIVFVLDLSYAWIDPRIRLEPGDQPVYLAKRNKLLQVYSRRGRKSFDIVFSLDLTRYWIDPEVFLEKARQIILQLKQNLQKRAPAQTNPGKQHNRGKAYERKDWKTYAESVKQAIKAASGSIKPVSREILRSPAAVTGLFIILLLIGGSIYAFAAYPYAEVGRQYYTKAVTGKITAPKNVPPEWTNWLRTNKLPTTLTLNSEEGTIEKSVKENQDGTKSVSFTATIDYAYRSFPQDLMVYFKPTYLEKRPFVSFRWITPDGREINLKNSSVESSSPFYLSDYVNLRIGLRKLPEIEKWFDADSPTKMPPFYLLFADPNASKPQALPGKHTLEISALLFEEDSDLEAEFFMLGQVSGLAGTDALRRDLIVPLLWGMPFALAIGITGAVVTTFAALFLSAAGTWQGGWLDNLIQRFTEVNMILPVLAIGILVFALYNVNLYLILGGIILLSIFGSPTKTFRSAFLQVKSEPFIESARAYGASNWRIIFRYMVPRIFPMVIPQLVILIPTFVFLEATLAIFNVFDPRYPTWGKIIHEAISRGAWWGGSHYWVLEPISLLLLAGLGFALLGSALERILSPRLRER